MAFLEGESGKLVRRGICGIVGLYWRWCSVIVVFWCSIDRRILAVAITECKEADVVSTCKD